jgi:hypothetical protein
VVRGIGLLLIALGMAHLIATPHIPGLLRGLRGTPDYRWALGPTLLNHVLVGVLLIPLGLTTWIAAAPAHGDAPWARTLLSANALTVLTLPVLLAVFMRDPVYYGSPLFLVGVGLVALIAVMMAVAVGLLVFG